MHWKYGSIPNSYHLRPFSTLQLVLICINSQLFLCFFFLSQWNLFTPKLIYDRYKISSVHWKVLNYYCNDSYWIEWNENFTTPEDRWSVGKKQHTFHKKSSEKYYCFDFFENAIKLVLFDFYDCIQQKLSTQTTRNLCRKKRINTRVGYWIAIFSESLKLLTKNGFYLHISGEKEIIIVKVLNVKISLTTAQVQNLII